MWADVPQSLQQMIKVFKSVVFIISSGFSSYCTILGHSATLVGGNSLAPSAADIRNSEAPKLKKKRSIEEPE